MTLQALIETYGYAGVLVGTLLEGDVALVAGGVCAKLTDLTLFGVIAAAFTGAYSLDQFFFYLGRFKGLSLLQKFPRMQARSERVFRLLHRHRTPISFGFRFVYGTRVLTPFLIGASGISRLRFAIVNAVGAAVWATAIGSVGYYVVGGALTAVLLREAKLHLPWILLGLLSLFAVVRLIVLIVRRRRFRRAA